MDVPTVREVHLLQARLMPRKQLRFGPADQIRLTFSGDQSSGPVWLHTIDLVSESGGENEDIPLKSVVKIRELVEPYRRQKQFQNGLLQRIRKHKG